MLLIYKYIKVHSFAKFIEEKGVVGDEEEGSKDSQSYSNTKDSGYAFKGKEDFQNQGEGKGNNLKNPYKLC